MGDSSKINKLTIAIPTYNRADFLKKNIGSILQQLSGECELLILDNASDRYVVAQEIKPILTGYEGKNVKIYRNPANVGLFANIVKCFELCETEWLYIVGDDDRLLEGGIRNILNDIEVNRDVVNISYKWKPESDWTSKRPVVGEGIVEFLDCIEGIHHVMFLSGNVYNAFKLRSNISVGFNYCFSNAPHLAMLLKFLEDNPRSKFFLSDNEIIDNQNFEVDEKRRWDKTSFFKGIQFLIDVPTRLQNKVAVFGVYRKRYTIFRLYKFFVKNGLDTGEPFLPKLSFKKSVFFYNIYGSLVDRLKIRIFAVFYPVLVSLLLFFKK
jgi:glycosyltransferase involved in cell wall biosynthesis